VCCFYWLRARKKYSSKKYFNRKTLGLLLDPRVFRLDDLLRRKYRSGEPLLCRGKRLTAVAAESWGFPSGVCWEGKIENNFGAFRLDLRVNRTELLPMDGFWRPSYLSQFASEPDSGLQVIEDKFVTEDDTLVSVLSLRNPSLEDCEIEIEACWGLRESGYGTVGHLSPPLDDLFVHLPGQAMRQLVFAFTIATDESAARRRIARWGGGTPLLEHRSRFDDWGAANTPLFDCSDPWLLRLYYLDWASRYFSSEFNSKLEVEVTALENAFFEGDFDRPILSNSDWSGFVLEKIIGLNADNETKTLTLHPTVDFTLDYFCLDDFHFQDRLLTIVWDDPKIALDAYEDGDKGLTVYVDRRRVYNQPTRDSFTIPLAAGRDQRLY
jgi:hypothetical protein